MLLLIFALFYIATGGWQLAAGLAASALNE